MIGALVFSTWHETMSINKSPSNGLLALKKRCTGLLLNRKIKGKKEYKTKFNETSPDWSFLLEIFRFKYEDD